MDREIILAGGSGTRLYPVTTVVSKQLLPIFDKPMIYYPFTALMLAGIRDILIISTPADQSLFERLLGDGEDFGMRFSYAQQDQPRGLADAFIVGADFVGKERVALVLGDNIFYGHGLPELLARRDSRAARAQPCFGYARESPRAVRGRRAWRRRAARYPSRRSRTSQSQTLAVTGLYYYDNDVVERSRPR